MLRKRLLATVSAAIFILTVFCFHTKTAFSADRCVMEAIEAWNQDISPENKQIKYDKMAISPFIFYRATNHLFWQDFANDERLSTFGTKKTATWIQGDLHVENMGSFCSDEGDVIFDVNDFDETIVADYQYDVWRLATSIVLVARGHNYDEETTTEFVNSFSESYLDTLGSYCDSNEEEDTLFTSDNTQGPLKEFLKKVERKKSREKMLSKWTLEGAFNVELEKLEAVTDEFRAELRAAWPAYGKTLFGSLDFDKKKDYFKIKDVAKRLLAGTGSLGTPRYYVLIEGKSKSTADDRILDVKLQSAPTALSYLSSTVDGQYSNEAKRHSRAYDAMTKDTDDHLGWVKLSEGHFSVRERSPFKDTFASEELTEPAAFVSLANAWGRVLATAHARADKDFDDDVIPYQFEEKVGKVTDGKVEEFKALVADIANEYASVVEADWKTFCEAIGH